MVHAALGLALTVWLAATPQEASHSPRGLARRIAAEHICAHTASPVAAIPDGLRAPAPSAPDWWAGPVALHALPELGRMPAACFDPLNPPSWEIQQLVNQAMEQGVVNRFDPNTSWPGPNNGPITLTWSFVPDGTPIPTGGYGDPAENSRLFQTFDSRFGSGNRAVWIAQFEAAFARWSELTGVTYVRVSTPGNDWDDGASFPGSAGSATRGDVRIAMKTIDGQSGILAYNYYPTNGDMVLEFYEPQWTWGAPSYTFLRNTIMHEAGHGLGLRHVCPSIGTKLMEPYLNTGFVGPQHDDIRGGQYFYGDRLEPDSTIATATDLGPLALGATLSPSVLPAPAVPLGMGTSIGIHSGVSGGPSTDEDHFRFNIAEPMIGTISVTPIGENYADYRQDTACNNLAESTFSGSAANLALAVLTSSGSSFYTATSAGFGAPETLTNVLLSPPGDLYVKVYATSSVIEPQLYELTIRAISRPVFNASDGAFTDRIRLTWNTVNLSNGYRIYRNTSDNRATAQLLTSPAAGSTQFDDLTAAVGATYYYWLEAIMVAGVRPASNAEPGFRAGAAPPANDSCAAASFVGENDVLSGTLLNATGDGAGTCGSSASNPDVWYAFTAGSCAGTLTVSTCGTHDAGGIDSGTDTVLSLFSACGGAVLACSDDAPGGACAGLDAGSQRDALIAYPLAAGQSVRIRVSKFGATSAGPFTLRVRFAPGNDHCDSAVPIASLVATAFCNLSADTDGPADALCGFAGDARIGGDLWYIYAPVTTGRFTVTTCGSGFDTRLAVYAACPTGANEAIACNDDTACPISGTLQSSVAVGGIAGSSYLIRVGGNSNSRGAGVVTVYCPADFNRTGSVSVQDLFDFLAAYFAGVPEADTNTSGVLSVQDIFDFLAAFFGGC